MALSTFGGLKTSIAAWLKRSDLTAYIPDFVSLAEARIARDLRLQRQMTSADLATVASTATVTLPSDWLETISAEVVGFGTLEVMPQDTAEGTWGTDTGRPLQMAPRGSSLVLYPTPDAVYIVRLVYFQRYTLASDSDTNWLLTNHPGLYLYAALAEAEPYLMDDARAAVWEAKYQQERDGLRAADQTARFSGATLRSITR